MSNPIEIKISEPLHTQSPAESVDTVVKVNGQTISEETIAREMQYHPADNQEQAYFLATQALVIQEVLCQRADSLFVNQKTKLTLNTDKKIEAVLEEEVAVPTPSEPELRRYYSQNEDKFRTGDLLEVSHILLAAAPEDAVMRQQLKEKAYLLIEQLVKQPKKFSKLAKTYSACPSNNTGGSLGQISKGQTVVEFEKALQTLPEGLSPHPIESRYGFHIIRIDRRVEGKLLPFELARDRIHQYMFEQVQRRAISQYISLLLAEAEIEGFDINTPSSPLVQ